MQGRHLTLACLAAASVLGCNGRYEVVPCGKETELLKISYITCMIDTRTGNLYTTAASGTRRESGEHVNDSGWTKIAEVKD